MWHAVFQPNRVTKVSQSCLADGFMRSSKGV
jgi:hypothetical protein